MTASPPALERRKAREIALTFLYQWDVRGEEVLPEMDEVLVRDRRVPAVADYVRLVVRGVVADADAIDGAIGAAAENWRVARMAVVDRNILRMAVFELRRRAPDVPDRVAINEAVELAKRFGTKQSGAFVNGVLDRVRREDAAARDRAEPAGPAGDDRSPTTTTDER